MKAQYTFDRRNFIKSSLLGGLSIGFPDLFRPAISASETADSLLIIWLNGGPSHLDLWDMKPDAPTAIGSLFKSIKTNVPGIEICEHLPKLAQQMDKICLIRSMTSTELAHQPATRYLLMGQCQPADYTDANDRNAITQSAAVIPSPIKYSSRSPFGQTPDRSADSDSLPDSRYCQSVFGLKGITATRQTSVDIGNALDWPGHRSIPTSTFNFSREPEPVHTNYGSTPFSRNCLLARRLIEAGSRLVTVNLDGWDHHRQIFTSLRRKLGGFDQAVSALLADMDRRGLLERTLVCVMGEFGRSPTLNCQGGRDHHSRVFSILLAGGGVPGGQVIGASDAHGYEPADQPIQPEDLWATIFHYLNLNRQPVLGTTGKSIVL